MPSASSIPGTCHQLSQFLFRCLVTLNNSYANAFYSSTYFQAKPQLEHPSCATESVPIYVFRSPPATRPQKHTRTRKHESHQQAQAFCSFDLHTSRRFTSSSVLERYRQSVHPPPPLRIVFPRCSPSEHSTLDIYHDRSVNSNKSRSPARFLVELHHEDPHLLPKPWRGKP